MSRGVVLEAYGQLTAEGYLTASQGAPTRVAHASTVERPPLPASSLEPRYVHDFRPTIPDLTSFPRDRWLRSLRSATRDVQFGELGDQDPRGATALRDQLMAYLGRVRGAAPEPEHTLVCNGFTQGFAILCRVLRDRGLDRVAVEQPGWLPHRLIAERSGLEPVPIPVDEHGLDVEALARSGCEVIVTTPAHHYPTGVVFASDRRAALLEWAEDNDGLIVEDDYDSELRYDRMPVGALQGLAPERVCYIGSASKRLAPGLRLGWMLSPSWLTGEIVFEKGAADGGSPMLEQLALADFIARGELDRHLRRVRLSYRRRREALILALESVLPDARVSGAAAGTYALVHLPEGVDEQGVLSAAAARGIALEGLADPPRAGLVLGYANVPEPAIERGVRFLAEAALNMS